MPRRDIDWEHEAVQGDYGLLVDEWYCVPPGILTENGDDYFIYLDRESYPPYVVVENADRTITVTPRFRLGLRPVFLEVQLKDGFWRP